jgi:hypothetical protein
MNNDIFKLAQPLAGGDFLNLLRCLKEADYRVEPKYYFRFFFITTTSLFTSPIKQIEELIYKKRIQQQELATDPIFILGHWRTGTTFLHNILTQDKQWGYVNTFQSFMPHVSILGNRFLKPLIQKTLPTTRPMDGMLLDVNSPQEEEFSLTNDRGLSIYLMLHFPAYFDRYVNQYLSYAQATTEVRESWKKSYAYLLKKASWLNQNKTLILKNPPNTARIPEILDLYPNAKFIYLYRDPYEVYFSTVRAMQQMLQLMQLHEISDSQIESNILNLYLQMIRLFLKHQHQIPNENFCCLSYEQLKSSPLTAIEFIYTRLQLADYTLAKSEFETHLQSVHNYKAATYSVDPRVREQVDLAWGAVRQQHDAWLETLGAARMR